MANIFTIENIDNFTEKINIDELYEKKRVDDINKLELFNKLLNRIHVRIKLTSKQSNEKCCWYVIPEIILGVPKFDQPNCISYIIDKLKINGFNVFYYHPNSIFISWNHWVPSYIRNEYKKKTGIVIDEYGHTITNDEITDIQNTDVINKSINSSSLKQMSKKIFTPIDSYKPKGNLVYSENLLHKIENKFN